MSDFIVEQGRPAGPRRSGGLDAPERPAAPVPDMPEIEAGAVSDDDELVIRGRDRKPFGRHAQKLAYAPRPGYHRHWFNEVPGRIDRAKEAGYECVMENGKAVKRPVGTKEAGGVLMAYLMEIPKRWYDEDMAAQQAEIDRSEGAIARGRVLDTQNEGPARFYNTAQSRTTSITHR